jgi:hypothetical protein
VLIRVFDIRQRLARLRALLARVRTEITVTRWCWRLGISRAELARWVDYKELTGRWPDEAPW